MNHQFYTWCTKRGDNPEAVMAFIRCIKKQPIVWETFEQVAKEAAAFSDRGDPMKCMGETRRRLGSFVMNSLSPGLCRMWNYKYKREFFHVGRMTKFNQERLAA